MQAALGISTLAERLDSDTGFSRLAQIGIPKIECPLGTLRHLFEKIRIRNQGFHGRLPRLSLNRAHRVFRSHTSIHARPICRLRHLIRRDRRSQYVGKNRVGIKRDRSEQAFELGLGVGASLRAGGRR